MRNVPLVGISVVTMLLSPGCSQEPAGENRSPGVREWINACQTLPRGKIEGIFQTRLKAGESIEGGEHYCQWKEEREGPVTTLEVTTVFYRYNTAAERWKGREAEEGYEVLSGLGDYALLKRMQGDDHHKLILLVDKGANYLMTSVSGPSGGEDDVETSLNRLRDLTRLAVEKM